MTLTRSCLLLGPLVLGLAGCSMSDLGDVATEHKRPEVHVEAPTKRGTMTLPIHRGGVRLGENETDFKLLQPKTAPDLREDSPISGEKYHVVGWRSDTEIVAGLTLDDHLVFAMITFDKATLDQLNEVVADLKDAYGDAPPPKDATVQYRFWEKGDERLMVVFSPSAAAGANSLTIALGVPRIMDALQMSPGASEADIREAKKVLAGTPTPPPAKS